MTCKHLDRSEDATTFRCAAFPRGIPEAIYTGAHDHHLPFEGDNGIRYEPEPVAAQ